MSKVTIEPALQKTLEQSPGAIQLVDTNGVAIGYFVPISTSLTKSALDSDFDEDEIDRRRQKGGYITTAELLKRLESR